MVGREPARSGRGAGRGVRSSRAGVRGIPVLFSTALVLAGCSSVENSAGGGSGGSGATGAGGGTGGVAAGGGGSATGHGGGGSLGLGGTGGADACAGAYLSLTAGGGDPPPVYGFGQACPGAPGSWETSHVLGYIGNESEGGPLRLHVTGCNPADDSRIELVVPLLDAGSAASESASLVLAGAAPWQTTTGLAVDVTSFGDVGQVVEGYFGGTMIDASSVAHSVYASFAVCRTMDLLAP